MPEFYSFDDRSPHDRHPSWSGDLSFGIQSSLEVLLARLPLIAMISSDSHRAQVALKSLFVDVFSTLAVYRTASPPMFVDDVSAIPSGQEAQPDEIADALAALSHRMLEGYSYAAKIEGCCSPQMVRSIRVFLLTLGELGDFAKECAEAWRAPIQAPDLALPFSQVVDSFAWIAHYAKRELLGRSAITERTSSQYVSRTINILCYPSEDERYRGMTVAHCLNYDVVKSSYDAADAIRKALALVRDYELGAFERDYLVCGLAPYNVLAAYENDAFSQPALPHNLPKEVLQLPNSYKVRFGVHPSNPDIRHPWPP